VSGIKVYSAKEGIGKHRIGYYAVLLKVGNLKSIFEVHFEQLVANSLAGFG
jgi:hypothetical protein